MVVTGSTIGAAWAARLAATPDRVALLVRRPDGTFVPRSWREVDRAVRDVRAALTAAGVGPGSTVAQVSENRTAWPIVDGAVLGLPAVHVPLHAGLPGATLARQIAHSGATTLVVAGPELIDRLRPHEAALAGLTAVFAHEPCERTLAGRVVRTLPLEAVTPAADEPAWQAGVTPLDRPSSGDALREDADPSGAEPDVDAGDPHRPALILYTSGTAGASRGVVLSHANVLANAATLVEIFDYRPGDVRLTALPLSHIYAHTCDLTSWVLAGNVWAIAGGRETVLADLAATSATMICHVPYFYESVRRQIAAERHADEADALRRRLGGRMRTPRSGGATLSPETFAWYADRGVTLYQGYGLTEASPVICTSTPGSTRAGSVGRPIPGVEVRLSSAGELLTRGPNVMLGYHRDRAATDAAIVDGWLATGDLATIDADGFVRIIGRRCERIALSTGKKVDPPDLEAVLTADPAIERAVLVGQDRPYLVALLVVRDEGPPGGPSATPAELAARIARLQADHARHERIGAFAVLPGPLTVEAGELTPKLSLCRPAILARYADLIESLYAGRTGPSIGRLPAGRPSSPAT